MNEKVHVQTRGEHVVDEFKEALLDNVAVSEQEHGLLVFNAQLQVQGFQILAEIGLSIASTQGDLKHLES